MTDKADDAKRPMGRPRKYDEPPKARTVAMQSDVYFWLSATSTTTGIPVSTLINGIIRSYISSPERDVYSLLALKRWGDKGGDKGGDDAQHVERTPRE